MGTYVVVVVASSNLYSIDIRRIMYAHSSGARTVSLNLNKLVFFFFYTHSWYTLHTCVFVLHIIHAFCVHS